MGLFSELVASKGPEGKVEEQLYLEGIKVQGRKTKIKINILKFKIYNQYSIIAQWVKIHG